MKIVFDCATARTAGGLIYGLRPDARGVCGQLHDGHYAFMEEVGALDAPDVLPGGATRQQTFPASEIRFTGQQTVLRP